MTGTGKSSVGRGIAPSFNADIVEIDALWKQELGLAPEERAAQGAYADPERRQNVLRSFDETCHAALRDGKTVIAQKAFIRPAERADVERIAKEAGAEFCGIWLEASFETLKQRIRARQNDVSDAPESVIDRQAGMDKGEMTWHRIDADRALDSVIRDVLGVIAGKKDS